MRTCQHCGSMSMLALDWEGDLCPECEQALREADKLDRTYQDPAIYPDHA
jgi:hypothetical protein